MFNSRAEQPVLSRETKAFLLSALTFLTAVAFAFAVVVVFFLTDVFNVVFFVDDGFFVDNAFFVVNAFFVDDVFLAVVFGLGVVLPALCIEVILDCHEDTHDFVFVEAGGRVVAVLRDF